MHPVRNVDAAAMTGAKQSCRLQNHIDNTHPSYYTRGKGNRPKNPSVPMTLGKRPADNITDGDPMELDDFPAPRGRATKSRRRQNHTDNIHSAASTRPTRNRAKNP